MSDLHIDDFMHDVATALVQLYAVFPRPLVLMVEDVCGPQEVDEFGVPNDRHQACFGALVWLREEGYIRFADTIRQEAVDQVVLTGRCFNLLIHPTPHASVDTTLPRSVQLEQTSHIYALRDALKRRSSTDLRSVVTSLIDAMSARPL